MSPKVGEALEQWMARAELSRAVRGAAAVCRWAEVVGPGVSKHARAESLKRGVLTVRVDSGVWATELSAHEPVLLERLNADLGEPVVTRLRFLVGAGRLGRPAQGDPQSERPSRTWPDRRDLDRVELSAEERGLVAGFAAAAPDPELGRAGARWLTATLKARRWLGRLQDPKRTEPERG
jgi:hypothetical protein